MRWVVSGAVYLASVGAMAVTLSAVADSAASSASRTLQLYAPDPAASQTLAQKRLLAAQAAAVPKLARRSVRALTPPKIHFAVMAAGLDRAEAADVIPLALQQTANELAGPGMRTMNTSGATVLAALLLQAPAAVQEKPLRRAKQVKNAARNKPKVALAKAGKKRSRPVIARAAPAPGKIRTMAQLNRAHKARLALLDTPGTLMFKGLLNRRS